MVKNPHPRAAHRNARFRAWKTHGLPLADTGWVYRGRPWGWFFYIACDACGEPGWQLHNPEDPQTGEACLRFENIEADGVEDMREGGCTHLDALLGEDPPAVKALLELELLSG